MAGQAAGCIEGWVLVGRPLHHAWERYQSRRIMLLTRCLLLLTDLLALTCMQCNPPPVPLRCCMTAGTGNL